MKIFAKIRFYVSASIIASITALIMVPLMFMFPSKKGSVLHYLNKLIFFFIGGKTRVTGSPDKNAQMILMNHQGIVDIIVIEAISFSHPRWVAKRELFDISWFGQTLRKGDMIAVDRQNKAGLIKFLKDAKDTVANSNRAIAIFPEGTRNPDQKLHKFKAGAKLVAEKLNLTVQPVIITGSKWLLNEHNRTAHSSLVHIKYLPSFQVDKSDKGWYEKLRDDMQQEIDNQYVRDKISR